MDDVLKRRMIAEPLGLYDCCGVSDGAACAIVTTPDIARGLGKQRPGGGEGAAGGGVQRRGGAVRQVGRLATSPPPASPRRAPTRRPASRKPREQVSLVDVHDCFSVTELVTMEDLQLSAEGTAIRDVLDGFFDADGQVPCQIDGGLKCFGHPIGASGLRMVYEMYLQLSGRAGARQRPAPTWGVTHNLGGFPSQNVAAIAVARPVRRLKPMARQVDRYQDIRDAVRALCAHLPRRVLPQASTWRASTPSRVRRRADQGRLAGGADPAGVRRLGPGPGRGLGDHGGDQPLRRQLRRLPRPDVQHGHAAAPRLAPSRSALPAEDRQRRTAPAVAWA